MDRMEQTVSIGKNLIEYYAQIDDIYDMPPETRFSIPRIFFCPPDDIRRISRAEGAGCAILTLRNHSSVLVTSPRGPGAAGTKTLLGNLPAPRGPRKDFLVPRENSNSD